jgi:hypothetical protein
MYSILLIQLVVINCIMWSDIRYLGVVYVYISILFFDTCYCHDVYLIVSVIQEMKNFSPQNWENVGWCINDWMDG